MIFLITFALGSDFDNFIPLKSGMMTNLECEVVSYNEFDLNNWEDDRTVCSFTYVNSLNFKVVLHYSENGVGEFVHPPGTPEGKTVFVPGQHFYTVHVVMEIDDMQEEWETRVIKDKSFSRSQGFNILRDEFIKSEMYKIVEQYLI
jgi:hypothetical protein